MTSDLSRRAARNALWVLAAMCGVFAAVRMSSNPRGMTVLALVAVAAALGGAVLHRRGAESARGHPARLISR